MSVSNTKQAEALADLIDGISVARLTTLTIHGFLHSRPMYTHHATANGEIWFFTDTESTKVADIAADPRVMLTYDNHARGRYITVWGTASVLHDPDKARELWNMHARASWPAGPDDPSLALIRVNPESAEFWDGPSQAAYALSLLKAVITGDAISAKSNNQMMTLD